MLKYLCSRRQCYFRGRQQECYFEPISILLSPSRRHLVIRHELARLCYTLLWKMQKQQTAMRAYHSVSAGSIYLINLLLLTQLLIVSTFTDYTNMHCLLGLFLGYTHISVFIYSNKLHSVQVYLPAFCLTMEKPR